VTDLADRLDTIAGTVQRAAGRREHFIRERRRHHEEAVAFRAEEERFRQAGLILAEAQRRTYTQLNERISAIAKAALEAVFDDPPEFRIMFETKRGRTEAVPALIGEGGIPVDPMTEDGGGAVDLLAFGLRLAMITMKRPALARVVALDESFRFVSRDLRPRVAALLRDLSGRLGFQFIIVTHDPELVPGADRIIRVRRVDGTSIAEAEDADNRPLTRAGSEPASVGGSFRRTRRTPASDVK